MLVCLALIGVVLLQRSEGGAFGTGGPTGLVTARGAGDLLTRTTWVLFTLFLGLSLTLTLLGGRERSSQAILERLKSATVNPDQLAHPTAPPAQGAPASSSTQSPPPTMQLPALGASGAAHPHTTAPIHRAPSAPPVINAPPPATAPSAPTQTPLALPPIGSSSGRPAPH